MASQQQLVAPAKLAVVQLTKDELRVRLAFWLGQDFVGGELVHVAPGATVAVEGADQLSATHGRTNWLSGVASGALYAFRTLCVPRRHMVLTELSGRLRSCDMDAVANSAAIGIARLVEMELPTLLTEGWTIEASVGEGLATSVSQAAADEPGSPSRAEKLLDRREAEQQESDRAPNPATLDPDLAEVVRQVPRTDRAGTESLDVKSGEGNSEQVVDAIEMIGEEQAAGLGSHGPSQVTPAMRYLHSSRTIHQLVTDRNRAVGIYLAVASLLVTASSALLNASPKGDLILPSRRSSAGVCRSRSRRWPCSPCSWDSC